MYSKQPTLSSARGVSLSTEHLNSGFNSNQHQFTRNDDPSVRHSRWQTPIEKRQVNNNARSGSATAGGRRLEYTNEELNESLRALTLLTRKHHCSSKSTNHETFSSRSSTIRSGISPNPARVYELSDDLKSREIDMIERFYGGRLKAQRAARVIQAKYREYRMRAQYAKLRSDKRVTRQIPTPYYPDEVPPMREHLASMEDLVLDRAYLDWESEAVGSIPDLTDTGVIKGNRSSAPSATGSANVKAVVVGDVSQSCSSLINKKTQYPSNSPEATTGSTSGFVSSPGSCSSGSLVTEVPRMPADYYPVEQVRAPQLPVRSSSQAYVTVPQESRRQSSESQPCVYYVVDQAASRDRDVRSTDRQLYVAVPINEHHSVTDSYQRHYMKVVCPPSQQQQKSATINVSQPTVLVRRSSLGSSNRSPAPVWCTPDGKMYTLAVNSESPRIVISPEVKQVVPSPYQYQQSQQPVFVLRRSDSNQKTQNHEIQQQKNSSVQHHQQIQQKQAPVMVKVHPAAMVSNAGTFQTSGEMHKAAAPVAADRWRKRMYRVCLNYFNK